MGIFENFSEKGSTFALSGIKIKFGCHCNFSEKNLNFEKMAIFFFLKKKLND